MNTNTSPWNIVKPCTQNWEQMTGDDRRRSCKHCGKHVHNVSAMTPKERVEFGKPANQHECITYVHRADGTFVDLSLWARLRGAIPALRLVRWSAVIALLPMILTGCMRGKRVATLGTPPAPSATQTPGGSKPQPPIAVPDGVKYETTVPEK